jgi:two-component system response regulator AtoC
MSQLLVIEDELVLAKNIARFFERQGHTVGLAHDGQAGLDLAREVLPDVVIVDFQLPHLNGLEVIRELRRLDDEMRIVMITGHGTINLAVEAMKAGSMDLLTKPLSLATLDEVVQRAVRDRAGKTVLRYYQQRDNQHASVNALVGDCPQMRALREMILAVSQSEPSDLSPVAPVLVQGETGTGKELVARACHMAGPRASGPFIEVNCAALPATLMEDELFGHEKGAFTDARARKVGLIEAADGGTLFLDEIGELELSLQAKLLRVLENFRVRPIGSVNDRRVNVRIVAATNRDLTREAQAGRFRSDLVYRLSVFQIRIPPLRERGEDVMLLAQEFLQRLAARYGRPALRLQPAAQFALRNYPWPGNVRELRNCLERAVLMQRGPDLDPEDLALPARDALMPMQLRPAASTGMQLVGGGPISGFGSLSGPAPLGAGIGVAPLDEVERQHLLQALETHGWNVSLAARALQVTRDTMRYRMAKHGLHRHAER